MLLFITNTFVFSTSLENLKIKIYKTIILPVVLYGCETWSLTLTEECRLRLFEEKILKLIFGPNMKDNEVFYSFYRSPNTVRVIKMSRASSQN